MSEVTLTAPPSYQERTAKDLKPDAKNGHEASSSVPETAHRILIIDDEAGIRESLETLLSLEGYVVDTAIDGETGLDTIGQRSYDLVLLDLALP